MKVVSSKQMGAIEADAYYEGASENDFMENAGFGIASFVDDYCTENDIAQIVTILAGKGNNAGDAYVAGIYLLEQDYRVTVYQTVPINSCSLLCQKNYDRFIEQNGRVIEIQTTDDIKLPDEGVIIDGLFGTGFHGTAKHPFDLIIKKANESNLHILSIDIPSGLNGDTGEVEGEAIEANETLFLQLPKTGFFLRQGWDYVGHLQQVDFGLDQKFIDEAQAELFLLTDEDVAPLLPPIKQSRHKYQAGFVTGLAGSPGMPGAAMLSSLSALRSGAGIVKLFHPEEMTQELCTSPDELIRVAFNENNLEEVIQKINQSSVTFIGPGLGQTQFAKNCLKKVLSEIKVPCVLDGDALTIIAEENLKIPKHSILTPHLGELNRLLNIKPPITLKFLQKCQKYAEEKKITLIIKGGPTFICHPGEAIMVNATGNPGMATAGSGDVLTGLITGLLSQGLNAHNAAALGVYLHGLAGDFAAADLTEYSLIASDIIEYFPEAFQYLEGTEIIE